MILKSLYLTKREDWRKWFSENFNTETEIWLVCPKKSTGKPRIEYNTVVEEALCFGWIDSNVKTLDGNHTIQRFNVRKSCSSYSQGNEERIKWLHAKGMIGPSVKDAQVPIVRETYQFPKDIVSQIKKD